MIDWYSVSFGGLWIFGLGLVVAALSIANYNATREKSRFGESMKFPTVRIMIDFGLVFFCLGLTGSTGSLWERIVWATLSLVFAVQTWWDKKLSNG